MRSAGLTRIALFGILSLVFFQLISDFIEATYVFGLLGSAFPVEAASVLLIFSPVVLLLLRDGLSGWPLVLVGELMLLSRVVEPMLNTRGRMLASGLGVACFMLLLPALITRPDREQPGTRGFELGAGLTLGLSLSILFRSLNSGRDISTYGMFQLLGWGLALLAGYLLLDLRGSGTKRAETPALESRTGWWRILGLALGTVSALILFYLSFSSPTVIARWTGASYPLIVAGIVLALSVLAIILSYRPGFLAALKPQTLLAWNLLFILSLVLTIAVHQTRFPADPGAYPFLMPAAAPLERLSLLLAILSFPVILVDFALLAQALAASKPSSRNLGAAFSLASLLFLLVIFAHIFTTVYDYIPVVGPLFRERFWLVYLIPGVTLIFPVTLLGRGASELGRAAKELNIRPFVPGMVVLLGLAAIAGVLLTTANPAAPSSPVGQFKVLSYNIQQGYSADGLENYNGQLRLLREADADIIGLQETDTARLAGGNADVVRFLADRLDLYAYYGPRSVDGTFGVALLSRYPIENASTLYHYSEHEQEATIQAQITVGDRTFQIYNTHLASEDALENLSQQRELLGAIEGRENVILMGDFNFSPDSPQGQYSLTTTALDDTWSVVWPEVDKKEGDPAGKAIDHIFVSPGTTVIDAVYVPGGEIESDHPAVTAVIAW